MNRSFDDGVAAATAIIMDLIKQERACWTNANREASGAQSACHNISIAVKNTFKAKD